MANSSSILKVVGCCCCCVCVCVCLSLSLKLVEVLLYVHRNRRFIRDGSPRCSPRLSHSSWALSLSLSLFLMIILMALVWWHFTLLWWAIVNVCDDKVSVITYLDHFTLSSMVVHGDRHQEGVGRLRLQQIKHTKSELINAWKMSKKIWNACGNCHLACQ